MIIDTNVHLGHWPFRHHGYEVASPLLDKLQSVDIGQAWVANLEGVWHKDLAGVNDRLLEVCATVDDGMFVPVGVVNPTLPDWEEELRRCHEEHQMRVIRVYPNYHQYAFDDGRFLRLLKLVASANLLIQVALKLEDERTQHLLAPVPRMSLDGLADAVTATPGLRLQVLNNSTPPTEEALIPLARSGEVYFDFAMLERVGAVADLVAQVGRERVLFGSHFPLFHVESAILKMKEADLDAEDAEAIRTENATRLREASR